jgi:hypothetical protein
MIQKRSAVAARWGTDTAATASFVPTRAASRGVSRLPMPKPLTEAIAPASIATKAVRARKERDMMLPAGVRWLCAALVHWGGRPPAVGQILLERDFGGENWAVRMFPVRME